MKIDTYHLSDHMNEGDEFLLSWTNLHNRQDISLHTHDNYYEIFWVEHGTGYHLINGQKKRLDVGDLVMMRPHDVHTYKSNTKGIAIMNIAFYPDAVDYLRNRYFPESTSYFWSADELPYRVKLNFNIVNRISQRVKGNISEKNDRLNLDSMLLFIFRMIRNYESLNDALEKPTWLTHAMDEFNKPEHFIKGAQGFANLCEKSLDYVNRIIKKHYEMTLSQLVHKLRMEFASRQLIITNSPIKGIAYESGYPNIGHFHVVFKQYFKVTPKQYRRMNKTIY